MPVVAILPAAAVVIGAVIGIAVPTMPVAAWLATLVIAWIVSIVAIVRRWALLTIVACLVGFAAGAAALAQGATREALEPAILSQSAPYRVDVAGSSGAVPVVVEADVVGDAIVTEFGAAMTVDVRRARDPPSSTWLASAGRVRITVAGNQVREQVGEWRAGRRIRAPVVFNAPLPYRNFGTIDQERRLALTGIRLFVSIKSASLVEVTHRANWLQETGAAARDWVRRAVATWVGRWDARSAAIVTAILIGDRAGLDAATESRLQHAGTYHVIAISGGNIAILVTLVTVVLRQAGVGSRLQACLAIAIVLAYAAIVGSGASGAPAAGGGPLYICAQARDTS
jgi:competence protein ComEC